MAVLSYVNIFAKDIVALSGFKDAQGVKFLLNFDVGSPRRLTP